MILLSKLSQIINVKTLAQCLMYSSTKCSSTECDSIVTKDSYF